MTHNDSSRLALRTCELPRKRFSHVGRHEVIDAAVQACQLADDRRRQVHVLGRRHDEHGLDCAVELVVQRSHLEFVFEVGDGPQALDEHLRVLFAGEIDAIWSSPDAADDFAFVTSCIEEKRFSEKIGLLPCVKSTLRILD